MSFFSTLLTDVENIWSNIFGKEAATISADVVEDIQLVGSGLGGALSDFEALTGVEPAVVAEKTVWPSRGRSGPDCARSDLGRFFSSCRCLAGVDRQDNARFRGPWLDPFRRHECGDRRLRGPVVLSKPDAINNFH